MKFKILSRSETEHSRSRRDDSFVVHRNLDPEIHPFQQEREYVRALRAAKLERHFAKPFVGALEGHTDGVYAMTVNPRNLLCLISGSGDGEVRVWDLPSRELMWNSTQAHTGFVRGLATCFNGDSFISCGDDKTVKLWSIQKYYDAEDGSVVPLETFLSKHSLFGCDTHYTADEIFTTCGEDVSIWDKTHPEPIHSFVWGGLDGIAAVKFNPSEHNILASCGKADRSIVLYDYRQKVSLKKIIQPMRNNNLCWNPMEPFHFTTANEDYCLYTFDMRKLDHSLIVHKDHVAAVLDVAYSPTGKEFVSASYDRSVRIFSVRPGWESKGRSREVYTAPRMQRCFSCRFSLDASFVFSGSDDGNVRIWKSQASKPLGVLAPKQEVALKYNSRLLEKFKRLKEIRQIHNKRILPKMIFKETKNQLIMKEAEARKTMRRRKFTNRKEPIVSLRKKAVLKEIE